MEKFWKEVQEDKNGQDKRDRDKVSFFSSILMITIHIIIINESIMGIFFPGVWEDQQ